MNFGKNRMKNCWMDPSGCWMCVAPLEIFSQMKECVQELESSPPRRRGGESGLANKVRAYMNGRKKSKKFFCMCLKNLKREEKNCSQLLLEGDHDCMAVVGILREVKRIRLAMFGSLLSSPFLRQRQDQSKVVGFWFQNHCNPTEDHAKEKWMPKKWRR